MVAYDSVHGNTKTVAEAIAAEIKAAGHEVEMIKVKNGVANVTGDFMFVGSPTRGGKMTGNMKKFIESLDAAAWKGKMIVAFDTVGPFPKDPAKRKDWLELANKGDKSAASKMRDLCSGRGLNCSKKFQIAVVGFFGPLAPDALDMAREETRKVLAGLE
ncbi:MAG TPA: flavodoxin domain-containing protein [Methanomassiliicoccales archaeon]|nr:flavodoxin domain-containing protein [Methanomassiliicoccales archaeon]